MPPKITPTSEENAIIMVDIGPANGISMPRLDEKSVGIQFLTAQPGMLGTAK